MLTHQELERIENWINDAVYCDNDKYMFAQRDITWLFNAYKKLYAENELIKRSYIQLLALDEKDES